MILSDAEKVGGEQAVLAVDAVREAPGSISPVALRVCDVMCGLMCAMLLPGMTLDAWLPIAPTLNAPGLSQTAGTCAAPECWWLIVTESCTRRRTAPPGDTPPCRSSHLTPRTANLNPPVNLSEDVIKSDSSAVSRPL
eukprot:3038419-Rhodomonas_salina.2